MSTRGSVLPDVSPCSHVEELFLAPPFQLYHQPSRVRPPILFSVFVPHALKTDRLYQFLPRFHRSCRPSIIKSKAGIAVKVLGAAQEI